MSVTAALPLSPQPVRRPFRSSPRSHWKGHFERNRRRPLPPTVEAVDLPPDVTSELAHRHILRALAIPRQQMAARLRALVLEGAR